MSAVPWRYTICEMTELPGVQDLYYDGIGAFEILGENVRLIPYKIAPTLEVQRVALEYAFVRPLIGWIASLEHAHDMLRHLPVPKPEHLLRRGMAN